MHDGHTRVILAPESSATGVPLIAYAATNHAGDVLQALFLVVPIGLRPPNNTSTSHRQFGPTSTRNHGGLHTQMKHSLSNVRALVLRGTVALRRRVVAGDAVTAEGELAVHENVMGHSDGARGEEEERVKERVELGGEAGERGRRRRAGAPCDGQHVGSDSEDSQNDGAGVLNDGRDRHTADGMCTYKRQVARQHHAPVASCPHAAQSVQSLDPSRPQQAAGRPRLALHTPACTRTTVS